MHTRNYPAATFAFAVISSVSASMETSIIQPSLCLRFRRRMCRPSMDARRCFDRDKREGDRRRNWISPCSTGMVSVVSSDRGIAQTRADIEESTNRMRSVDISTLALNLLVRSRFLYPPYIRSFNHMAKNGERELFGMANALAVPTQWYTPPCETFRRRVI